LRVACALFVAALVFAPTSSLAEALGMVRFDLGTAAVQGQSILGRTIPTVVQMLGRPDDKTIRRRHATLRYGTPSKGVWPLTISFLRNGGVLRASGAFIASAGAREARLGPILHLKPRAIQRLVRTHYGGKLRLTKPYDCRKRPLSCRGEFAYTGSSMKVAFGLLYPRAAAPRYILFYV
jgi:hypothetical protein